MASEQLRLVDGTIVRKCPTVKPLYCSRAGKFYSVHNAFLTDDGWVLREVKPNFSPAMRTPGRHCFNGKRGCVYPIMRQYDKQMCHKLVALTWIGPRPFAVAPDRTTIPMEIDHINGDILDWSAENLEYVTPEENIKRAKLLRILRSNGRDPRKMSYGELREIFRKYRFEEPEKIMEADMTQHREI